MILKTLFLIFSVLFLIYLAVPSPTSINDFPNLPNSYKSTDPGDTTQLANISGYFSDNYRAQVTKYYKDTFQRLSFFPFKPLRLNYPPETAFTWIKDQTQSTYLEEYTYPLKGSIFVNGFEPIQPDGSPRFPGAVQFGVNGNHYDTKVTVRYYPTSIVYRLTVWLGINLAIIGVFILGKKILSHE